MKTIQYFTRSNYGTDVDYIASEADAAIVRQLTGKKTITSKVRELLRDLTGGQLTFEQILPPTR